MYKTFLDFLVLFKESKGKEVYIFPTISAKGVLEDEYNIRGCRKKSRSKS
ncbi:hypothetical protein GCM10011573_14570 [Enterococcus wangshanyuanii]|uniref:Uncharacterized protein n=1 Tax=Enterococcus wangshanyuanii TaxID=2005703 RepID=A0ABQ1NW61_9ENTE|nr:hypothetical protein GCM10011573_14570 [Enterococcus wangshanyuanii]